MYKRIIQFKDKKCFGNETIIFQNEENFFIIMIDRSGKTYFFADLKLECLYPANSYIKKVNFEYDAKSEAAELKYNFDIDLSKYGCSKCPDWLRALIKNN